MTTLIHADAENNAEEFWNYVEESDSVPEALAKLNEFNDGVIVSDEYARQIRQWAERAPGYADGPEFAREALLFEVFEDATVEQIVEWKEALPNDLNFGEFEDAWTTSGEPYRYGAWNTDGDWCLAWNDDNEFKEQLAELQRGGEDLR